jgi:hypothetical protein
MVQPLAATDVQPGYLVLDVVWQGSIHTFDEGALVPVILSVMDDQFLNALDPATVTISWVTNQGGSGSVEWLFANWDGVTIQTPSVGVLARTGPGVFETWLDTKAFPGNWEVQGATTGAGQGSSDVQQFVVSSWVPDVPEQVTVVSTPLEVDLEIYRGDDFFLTLTVLNPDGSPTDLTGATVAAGIQVNAQTVSLVSTITSNQISLQLSNAVSQGIVGDLGTWECEITYSNTTVQTLAAGSVTIEGDIV